MKNKNTSINKLTASRKIITYVILVFFSLLAAFPIFIMVSRSFFTAREIIKVGAGIFPKEPTVLNYSDAFKDTLFIHGLKNTILMCVCNVIGVPLTAFMSAYAFTKVQFIGRKFWFTLGLCSMMIPGILLLIPVFKIFVDIGWYDTMLPLTVTSFFGGGIMNIFLIMMFIRGIPKEMFEASELDGANTFVKMFYLTLPLIKTVVIYVGVTAFFGAWNDFMRPLLYVESDKNYTINMFLYFKYLIESTPIKSKPNMQMTYGVILMLPMLIVFIIFQKQLIEGIQLGALK